MNPPNEEQNRGGEMAIVPQVEMLAPIAQWSTDARLVGAQRTILLVEDESFVRQVTGEVLRSSGYNVLVAKDAREAARLYEAHGRQVDLLLTDVILPGENGRELAAKLRRQNPMLPVLLITGYAKELAAGRVEAGIDTMSADASELLPKPFSGEALLSKVRQMLEGRVPGAAANEEIRRVCGPG